VLEHVKVEYVPSFKMTPLARSNNYPPGLFLFSSPVQVMVASSQRVFRDAGCLPTIPEVPLEISTAGKLLMTTAGRPY
jgi:hypothetical protein